MGSLNAKRAAIIFNPVARGLSRRPHLLGRSVELLAGQGIEASLVATTGPGSASEQVRREIEAGCDLVIAAGGDGTVNEVANGMLHTGVPLAILPGGTANVLARELRMPMHPGKVAAQISHYVPRRMAAGALNINGSERRIFLCMAGAGLDAEIVSRLNLDLKAAAGKLAYYVCGFAQAFRPLSEFEIFVDGKRFLASFALISRVRNYGGDLEIAGQASLLRSDFEVVLFRGKACIQFIPYLVGVVLKQAHHMKGVTMLHAKSVKCPAPAGKQILVQVDGELAGSLPIAAEIIPDALTVLVPPDYVAREQRYVALPACA